VHQSFYQTAPKRDTPYRELLLTHTEEKGWHVRLSAGTEWGRGKGTVLREESVQDFDNGKPLYDQLFNELVAAGWKPYSPIESGGHFQTKVNNELPKPRLRDL
jgi:hypothetical protein